tara:strand:+ start:672 stop:959 length:288 start_codon:yes stop_codon:yes gene_type:complete
MATEAELKTMFADKLESLDKNSVKKSDFDSLVNELKHSIKDKQDDHKDSAESFIDHMTTCTDKSCSMNMLGDDIKKHGFLSGYALAKKEHTGKGV